MNAIRYVVAAILLQATLAGMLVAGDTVELKVDYTATFGPDSTRLEIAPDRWHVMRTHLLKAVNGTSLAGATEASCHQTYEEVMPSGAWTNSGLCTWYDGDGDQIFEAYDGSASSGVATGVGSGRLLGGTGKFAGITGALTWNCGEPCEKHGLYSIPDH